MSESAKEYILATARELYGRSVYSHKTHEKEREHWGKKAERMNYVNIALVSLTTFFSIVSAILKADTALLATAVLATSTTAFVIWQSNFDPLNKENQHRTAAKELLWIREQLLLLIQRCHSSTEPVNHLQMNLESITRELTSVYKFAPSTSAESYENARRALKEGEFTFSAEEIDSFLPFQLRSTSQKQ